MEVKKYKIKLHLALVKKVHHGELAVTLTLAKTTVS